MFIVWWVVMHLVPVFAFYTVGGALLYRPVYRHFYEKQRLIKSKPRDRWGEEISSAAPVYRSHEKAHEEALPRAALAAALWPISMWPLIVHKVATPTTAARKAELKEEKEERDMQQALRRKAALEKMEREIGIDNTVKALDYKVRDDR